MCLHVCVHLCKSYENNPVRSSGKGGGVGGVQKTTVIAYEILLRFSALLWEDPMGAQQATASSDQGYI